MGENTNIEWANHTFNAWIGCTRISPACDHCYAEAWDHRFGGERWGPHAPRTRTSVKNWNLPLRWNRDAEAAGRRDRVFCSSLADVFDNHPSVLPQWRADLWELIRTTPHLDWMLLSKRPGNIAKMLPPDWGDGWPNVWLGCTVVNQEEVDRDVPKLLAVPAAIRFLSMEPLLGRVELDSVPWPREWQRPVDDISDGIDPLRHALSRIHLVIVGGESGPGARPMHPDWVRSLRDQCTSAGTAFHFKQWGDWEPRPGFACPDHLPSEGWHHFDPECSMRRVGKKAAGRFLDGRTWDEMPKAA